MARVSLVVRRVPWCWVLRIIPRTPGVIGLILKTEHHGTILTTSDAIYTADSYRQALPPGGTINATTDEFYDNLERIKAMEKNYNATLLFGHDIDQILDWAGQGVID